MLQAIRSKAGSLFVKILFGLLIATFGLWGIGDIFRDRTPETVVATVGGQTIAAQSLQNELQPTLERLRAQLGGNFDLHQARQFGIVDSVLGQMIERSLLDQEAQSMQLEVSNAVVRSAIFNNPSFRGTNGQFDRGMFNQALAMNQMTEDSYVTAVRSAIPRSDLVQAVTGGVVAPAPLVDLLYRYQNETRTADIVAFPVAAAAPVPPPADAVLTKFYDAHQDQFRAAEYRTFTLLSLTPDDLARTIKIPEDRLKEAYQNRKNDFQMPARRDVQQILVPSEAQAKAAEAALAAGKSWQDVATTLAHMDPSTIDLGTVTQKELPTPLGTIAFGLALNTPSAPEKSLMGWHILRVVKIDPATVATFAAAEPKLNAELARGVAGDRLQSLGDKVDDAIAGGAAIAKVAQQFGLKTTQVAAADVGGRDPAGKPVALPVGRDDVLKVAFATDSGQTTRVHHLNDGAIFVVDVDKIVAPHVKPLTQVKDAAIALWQADEKRRNVAKDAAAFAAAIKPPATMASLAAQKKLTVTNSAPLRRQANEDGTVPPLLVAKLFAAKAGAVVTATDAAGSYVAELKTISAPQAPPPGAAATLTQTLDSEMQNDLSIEFTSALRQRFPVTIAHGAIDRLF